MLPQWVQMLLILLQEYWSARRSDLIRFLTPQVELLKKKKKKKKKKLPGNRFSRIRRQQWLRGLLKHDDRKAA